MKQYEVTKKAMKNLTTRQELCESHTLKRKEKENKTKQKKPIKNIAYKSIS